QVYVVADSPKTIAESLSSSLYLAVKQYVRISDEERGAVERSLRKFPCPAWVRVKHGKYKGDIAQVFDSDLPNDFIAVLVPPREFPYSMPSGSRSLLDRSRLPTGDAVSDIQRGAEVVGCQYKGERYYMGLLLKNIRRDRLERVICPHADDIKLHLQSGWNQSFLKATVVAFSMQFLRAGDWARIVKGDLSSTIGQVLSTDLPAGSLTLELILSGRREETDVRLEDIKRVFHIGDTVRVVAGPYLGVEGHIIQMEDDVFRLCQNVSKEEPPPDDESIQIGDQIEVLVGQHMGKTGTVRWLPKASNDLWFQDGSSSIPVPTAAVRRIPNLQTLRFTQDRGYDVKPGDVVKVVRGPEYPTKGVVRSVDFLSAHLTVLSEIDHSLVNVPIGFVIKIQNASLDSFKKDIGQEVFIVRGDRKGYRATLYSFNSKDCTVALHGQQRTTMELKDIVTRLNGVMLEGTDMISFCEMRQKSYLAPQPRSVTPPPEKVSSSSSASINSSVPSSAWTSWTASPEDNMANNSSIPVYFIIGPLAWLMNKEFSSKFTTYHAMLKVSPSFMGGRLHNRFVLTACPDPFLGQNGPAPEGFVAVFCSSNGAGAAMQHYHISAMDLSPAPPRKKNQQCIILDGSHRGSIVNIAKCYLKKNTVDITIAPSTLVNLRFDQICLVEQSHMTM
ncbi:hypothetical protein CY34DRAFT_96149, partial [Suillus luteus UH-Slu-Lm8-n1]